MNFEWFICRRYLKAKKKQGFISLITFISIAGVTVGVMALIVVIAVMTGFTKELREKILGVNSHIIVQQRGSEIAGYQELAGKIAGIPGVIGTMPYIYAQTMITSGGSGSGVVVRGIDADSAITTLSIGKHMVEGRLNSLHTDPAALPQQRPAILLGTHMARELRLGLGDKVKLISTSGPLTPLGIIPKIKVCLVTGIFETGMYEYDSTLAFVALATAQDFLNLGDAVHGLEITVDDIYRADTIAADISTALGPGYLAKDWMQMNRNLFSALKLEKTAMFIVQALIVLVASFNIISTLTMVVMEKNKEIAILKSMGATAASIRRIFIYEGLIIGITGTLLGVSGGLFICQLLSRYQFIKLPPDVYPFTTLPVEVLAGDVTIIALSAVLITFLATLYPSYQAARVDPAVTLRYE